MKVTQLNKDKNTIVPFQGNTGLLTTMRNPQSKIKGIDFNGINQDGVVLENDGTSFGKGDFTLEWYGRADDSSGATYIRLFYTAGMQMRITTASGSFSYFLADGTSNVNGSFSNADGLIGRKVHLVMVRDESDLLAYIDGELVDTVDISSLAEGLLTGDLRIMSNGSEHAEGQSIVTRMYNRALSIDEITQLYNNGRPDQGIMPPLLKDVVVEQLVVNGEFVTGTGWNLGADWAIVSEAASCDATDGQTITQTINELIVGNVYCVEYEIISYTSGTVWFSGSGFSASTQISNTVGKHAIELECTNDNQLLRIISSSGGYVGVIDNISIKRIGNVLDADFSGFNKGDKYVQDLSSNNNHIEIINDPDAYISDKSYAEHRIIDEGGNGDMQVLLDNNDVLSYTPIGSLPSIKNGMLVKWNAWNKLNETDWTLITVFDKSYNSNVINYGKYSSAVHPLLQIEATTGYIKSLGIDIVSENCASKPNVFAIKKTNNKFYMYHNGEFVYERDFLDNYEPDHLVINGSFISEGSYLPFYHAGQTGLMSITQNVLTDTEIKTASDKLLFLAKNIGVWKGEEYNRINQEEKIINGTFDTDLSNWILSGVDVNNTIVWENGRCRVISVGTNIQLKQYCLTVGNKYRFTCDIDSLSGSLTCDASSFGSNILLLNGENDFTFVATSTLMAIKRTPITADCYIDNISVKEVRQSESVNLIPDASSYFDEDGIDWWSISRADKSYDAEQRAIHLYMQSTLSPIMSRPSHLVIGKRYRLSYKIKSPTNVSSIGSPFNVTHYDDIIYIAKPTNMSDQYQEYIMEGTASQTTLYCYPTGSTAVGQEFDIKDIVTTEIHAKYAELEDYNFIGSTYRELGNYPGSVVSDAIDFRTYDATNNLIYAPLPITFKDDMINDLDVSGNKLIGITDSRRFELGLDKMMLNSQKIEEGGIAVSIEGSNMAVASAGDVMSLNITDQLTGRLLGYTRHRWLAGETGTEGNYIHRFYVDKLEVELDGSGDPNYNDSTEPFVSSQECPIPVDVAGSLFSLTPSEYIIDDLIIDDKVYVKNQFRSYYLADELVDGLNEKILIAGARNFSNEIIYSIEATTLPNKFIHIADANKDIKKITTYTAD